MCFALEQKSVKSEGRAIRRQSNRGTRRMFERFPIRRTNTMRKKAQRRDAENAKAERRKAEDSGAK